MTDTYVDANVLIDAFGHPDHPNRLAAQTAIMAAADQGAILTSTLTVDEFTWVRMRESGQQAAVAGARTLLRAPGLVFVAVETHHVRAALDHMERHGLDPRDAIHLAVCIGKGCSVILSDDGDFDAIGVVERRPTTPRS